MSAVTKPELDRLVAEFLHTPQGSYPDPQSCADTKGRCDGVSTRLCIFLTRKGLECEVWEGTSLLPELGADAHEEWQGFRGEDQKFLFHVVVKIGSWVIDLTGAQYGKAFSKPYVKPFAEFRSQWKQVKPSKWQDWKRKIAARVAGQWLMKLATDVYHDGDEFVLFIPTGTPKVKVVRRSRKTLAAMKSLSDITGHGLEGPSGKQMSPRMSSSTSRLQKGRNRSLQQASS